MKTTLDIADPLLREAKARAALDGQTLKAFVTDTLRSRLRSPRSRAGSPPEPAWRRVFGALKHGRKALRELDAIVAREFESINPKDWK